MLIYCCKCDKNISADLLNGSQLGRKFKFSKDKFFWKCSKCRSFIGTYKTKENDFAPLGAIPTKKIREMQQDLAKEINVILDLKKDIPNAEEKLFIWLSKKLQIPFSTSLIISRNQASRVSQLLQLIINK